MTDVTKMDLVGKLFINESRKGTQYLRGTVNGKAVVAFLAKDGKSFNVKLEAPKEDAGAAKHASHKAPARVHGIKSAAKKIADADVPF